MTEVVFVDTDVFVYARDATETIKQPISTRWLDELWAQHRGRTSAQVLNEYYVTVTRKLSQPLDPEDAWDYVRALLSWEPQEVNGELLLRGREIEQRYSTSWRDSLIVAAAQLQDCSLLLSEDLQDGMVFGPVTVRNPFTARIAEETGEYAAGRPAVSRHRPRGRPRARSPLR